MFPTHGCVRSAGCRTEFARVTHDSVRVPACVKVLPFAVRIVEVSTPDGSTAPPDAVGLGSVVDSYVGTLVADGSEDVRPGSSSSPLKTRNAPAPTTART